VTTIRAPLPLRAGGGAPLVAVELVLPALTVVSGLQLLRLMVATVVGVYRDRLGAPLTSLALFAFLVVGLGFLAAPVARLLGRRRALLASAAGVALVRLVVQLVPDPLARWLLAPVGVVLFLWFVPLWLVRDGRGFGLALLVGLAVDTALAGLGGSWDYAWSITPWTVALAAALAGAALWALAALPDRGRVAIGAPDGRWAPLPLAGIGPALFLHALMWQNLGWQATLSGRSQSLAFAVVMVANLAAGAVTALAREVRWPVVGMAVAMLAVAVALAQEATLAACVLGQAATAVLLVLIVRRATDPGTGEAARLGPVTTAWAGGMALFVLLVFAYYAAYDVVLPFGNEVLPALAALLLAAAAIVAMGAPRRPGDEAATSRPGRDPGARDSGARDPGDRDPGAVETRRRLPDSSATLPTGALATGEGLSAMATGEGVSAMATGGGLKPMATGEGLRPMARPAGPYLISVGVGVVLLLAPTLFWLTAPDPVAAAPAPWVRVMSYNLHFGFDIRGWSDLEGIARAIEASGAEVVGLQEVSRGWYVNGSTDMLAWLQRRLRMPHARFAGASDEIWGNAVLSRYPIVASEVIQLPREGVPLRRNALAVELDLGAGRRLDVVVTHLHHVEGPEGARVRLAQLPPLLERVAGRPATVLLGDFNAEPGSAEIALVRGAGLTDAFVAGAGRPADERTWPSDRPDRHIDYIWLSGDLTASGFAAAPGRASDHRGVAVTVRAA
jgi:endonuclease/exonuclease/phosphatase family metal-dependent hydrolase